VLINLNEIEVKFALYAVREAAAKLEAKLTSEAKTGTLPTSVMDLLKANTTGPVRLTKAGRPYKKPGRKPGKKSIKQPEQQAA
tara:strand:- start:673 stop:921 length:249 start_codon:yes stop_codon:yes gene_type:complete